MQDRDYPPHDAPDHLESDDGGSTQEGVGIELRIQLAETRACAVADCVTESLLGGRSE